MTTLINPLRRPRPAALALSTLLLALLASLVPGALRPQAAHANGVQASIMMDDDQLVYRNDRTRDAALAQMKSLGVNYVRATMLWSVVAAGATPGRHHFNPANPATYPARNWNRFDNLVRSATRLGIGVYFDVTGPGPSWSHARPPRSARADVRQTWMPNPSQFFKFVTAVGRRYSGSYRIRGAVIPAVRVWSLWNEPNQGGWITPQWKSVGGQLIPYSPILYRRLFFQGRLALQNTGHGKDSILIGETAPTGVDRRNTTSAMDPTTFVNELFCVNPSTGQPYAGGAAAVRDCGIFKQFPRFAATAWAHHPYTKFLAPSTPDSRPGSITIGNLSNLSTLLDKLAATTGHIASGLQIVSSEFGYETNPPDRYYGISLDRQAEYINEGDFLAYINPRVTGQTQFLLRDALPLRQYKHNSRQYWSTYQSGIEYGNGAIKPSYSAYLMPLVAFAAPPAGGQPQLGVWGQLRFLANATGRLPTAVQVEFRPKGAPANAFAPYGAAIEVTDSFRHFFYTTIPYPGPGSIRLHWSGQGMAADHYSRIVAVG